MTNRVTNKLTLLESALDLPMQFNNFYNAKETNLLALHLKDLLQLNHMIGWVNITIAPIIVFACDKFTPPTRMGDFTELIKFVTPRSNFKGLIYL